MGASLLWIKDDRYSSQIWLVFCICQQTLFFAKEDVCPSFPMLFALELRSISHPLSPAACTAKPSQSGSQRSCEFFAFCKTGLNKQLTWRSSFVNLIQLVDFGYFVACTWRAEIEPQLSPCADRETSWSMARNWLAAVYRSAAGTGQWPLESELWQLNWAQLTRDGTSPSRPTRAAIWWLLPRFRTANQHRDTTSLETQVHLPLERSEINGHRLQQLVTA